MKLRNIARAIGVLMLVISAPLFGGTFSVDVTINGGPSGFSAGAVTLSNLSDPGYQITRTDLAGAFSDYIHSASLAAPAGGAYTALGNTRISSGNPNDGCNAQTFALTGFEFGETFGYTFDPEDNACANVVFDFRPRLNTNAVTISANFRGPGIIGTQTLTGHTWTKELINRDLPSSSTNDLYRLTLSGNVNETPEPATFLLSGAAVTLLGAARWKKLRVQGN